MLRRVVQIAAVLLVFGLVFAVFAPWRNVSACGAEILPIEVINRWPRDEYLLLLLREPGSGNPGLDATAKAVDKLSRRVNIRLVEVPAGGGARVGGPAAVLVSPRGRMLARFESPPGEAELASLFRDHLRKELADKLRKNDAVVLVFSGPDAPHAEANHKAAAEAIQASAKLFRTTIVLLTLDVTDEAERALILNLGIPAEADSEGVLILLSRGRMMKPLAGEVSRKKILDRFQYLFTPYPFCFQHQFGEDILLEWQK